MTQRSHSISRGFHHAIPRPRAWREIAAEEVALIGTWYFSWMIQGFERFLRLGVPAAATVLEIQNLKRRIPEIGEIDRTPKAKADL